MSSVLIGQYGSIQVAHNLMHIDQNSPLFVGMKSNRLDVRIDFRPLPGPIGADFFGATHKTTLERFGPSDICSHGGEGFIDVARVESGISRAQQFYFGAEFIGHSVRMS